MSHSHIIPRVSVVMPTRNAGPFLRPAIEGILNQSFRDFELIVINDGSTDNTPEILGGFNDDRLIVLTNERNLGIAASTNLGLAASRGEYVALQDSDDLSLPHRFQTQVEFLNAHPEIALIGPAMATLIDENGRALEDFYHPAEEIDLRWKMLWTSPIHHTGVMARRKAILDVGGYSVDPFFKYGSDYEFLSRVAMRYRVANLTSPLVLWRKHFSQCSRRNEELLQQEADVISFRNICLLINDDAEIATEGQPLTNPEQSAKRDQWFRYLGAKAFLYTPDGALPALTGAQVTAGLGFLREIQRAFYRRHDFTRAVVTNHRKRLNWIWGKHAVALAVRAPWDLAGRIRIFSMGIRLLQSAGRATVRSLA